MTLIKNKCFKAIFDKIPPQIDASSSSFKDYYPKDFPYIGMGNPDAKLLFVGREKAFDTEASPEISKHELVLNWRHWFDIVKNNNVLFDHLHPKLRLRNGGLKGQNPFSPLTLDETCEDVISKGNHTYRKIEKVINSILYAYHCKCPTSVFQISPKFYEQSTFNYCFLTDISDRPKKHQNEGEQFNYENFMNSPRYIHIKEGPLGKFYRGFKKIVIYSGKLYAGPRESNQRLDIIQLFNPNLVNDDLQKPLNAIYDVYEAKKGAKIIICNQLTERKIFNSDYNLRHLLAIIGIGDIL